MVEEVPIRLTLLQMTIISSGQKIKNKKQQKNYLRALESEPRQVDTGGDSTLRRNVLH